MHFYFHKATISGPAGAALNCWLPAPFDEAESYLHELEQDQDPFVNIDLDGETRTALRSLIGMAFIYNAQHARRERLGYDCGVFALSCERGDPYVDRDFSGSSGDSVLVKDIGKPRPISNDQEGAAMGAGRILIIVPEKIKEAHLVVQATADERKPMHLSKINSNGPVVLSDMEQIAGLYNADFVAEVSQLSPA